MSLWVLIWVSCGLQFGVCVCFDAAVLFDFVAQHDFAVCGSFSGSAFIDFVIVFFVFALWFAA